MGDNTETKVVTGVMERELEEVIGQHRADPDYIPHRVIERYNGVHDIEFTMRRSDPA